MPRSWSPVDAPARRANVPLPQGRDQRGLQVRSFWSRDRTNSSVRCPPAARRPWQGHVLLIRGTSANPMSSAALAHLLQLGRPDASPRPPATAEAATLTSPNLTPCLLYTSDAADDLT